MDKAAGEQAQECPWCGDADHFNEECTEPVTGDQVKRVTVDSAREQVLLARATRMWSMRFRATVDQFEAAVREDERERARADVRIYMPQPCPYCQSLNMREYHTDGCTRPRP